MEKKKIIFIILILTVFSCDVRTVVQIINDTEFPINIKTKRVDFEYGRNETILPGEIFGFAFLGSQPPRNGQDAIATVIRKYWEDGFTLTILDKIYNLTPDDAAALLANNTVYDDEKRIYYLNVSIIFNEIKYHQKNRKFYYPKT